MGPLKTQTSKVISMLEIEYIMFIWGWYSGGNLVFNQIHRFGRPGYCFQFIKVLMTSYIFKLDHVTR